MSDIRTDEELLAAVVTELADRDHRMLELVLRPATAFQLVALIQLALRHPGVSVQMRYVGRTIIEHVRATFSDAPAFLELLRRGDDPDYDVPRSEQPR